ncbi:hypothetical protein ICN84_10420 [Akkermansia glycaniphila]|uniref:hypothetical protein n=1 Tax=Akkermansia glycaniphila TaxID=1679444 RepID=UPI001C00F6B7|nr:hypothetical protein [Akkermansia glycaniphila]MBT9450482.1 hypothetical protein [Akkermansia glycaniphila]
MKTIIRTTGLLAAALLLASCGKDDDEYDDHYHRGASTKHLMGNYDLQQDYSSDGSGEIFYVVQKGGGAGRNDGGVFRRNVSQITVVPPNEVYAYINHGGNVATGAYKLDVNSGEVTGPLPEPEQHPWIDAWEFFYDYL